MLCLWGSYGVRQVGIITSDRVLGAAYVMNICDRVLDKNHEKWRDEEKMPALLLTGENLGHFTDEAWDIALGHKEIGVWLSHFLH